MRIPTMLRTFVSAVTLVVTALVAREAGAQGALSSGETGTGSILSGGLVSTWTFSANAGDAWVVRIGELSQTGSLSPRIRVFSPSAALLGSSYGTVAAELSGTAASSGTYTVEVGDQAGTTASGTYQLTLALSGHAASVPLGDEGGPLTNGQRHTGAISVGELDVWTVTLAAGDLIQARMGETTGGSSLTPELVLYSPAGVLLDWGYGTAATEVSATAPVSGEYVLVAADYTSGFAGSGGYRLTLARTGAAVTTLPDDEGGALTNGVMHTGVIEVGDLDLWTVTLAAGEAIQVRIGETGSGGTFTPLVRLYSPAGVLLDWGYGTVAAEAVATAPLGGDYLVVAGDYTSGYAGSGSYRLTLARTGAAVTTLPADEGGALANGALHTGTVDVGDLDLWTVTLAAGDAIQVRMGETTGGSTLTPLLRLYSPAGVLLDWGYGTVAAEVTANAPVSGDYLVVAGDYTSGNAGSGGYRLSLARTGAAVSVSGGDEGGALANGIEHMGTVAVGDLDAWVVTLAAGDAIVVRMGETSAGSTLTPLLRLYSPAGVLLDWGYGTVATEAAATAPVSGDYLVVAGDYTSGFTGSGGYRLSLSRTGAAFATSGGDQGGPLVPGLSFGELPVGDLDLWSLDAIAGQSLIATMEEIVIGSSLTPMLRLYSPAGVLLDWAYGTSRAQVSATAPVTGTYLVVAADNSSGYAGSGAYRLTPYYTTGTDDGPQAFRLMLAPPSPNPCADRTVLRFGLAAPGDASLAIYDAQGRLVRTLLEERGKAAGEYAVEWDGGDTRGARLRPGVYLARLQAAGRSLVQKVLLVQ